jgi:hypothetical protein
MVMDPGTRGYYMWPEPAYLVENDTIITERAFIRMPSKRGMTMT